MVREREIIQRMLPPEADKKAFDYREWTWVIKSFSVSYEALLKMEKILDFEKI
jgi:hypothetical protein